MIPTIATYLAIAASFWGQPVDRIPTVEYNRVICGTPTEFSHVDACSLPGHIYINPDDWFGERRISKCVIMIHEYGHSIMLLPHSSTGVMMASIEDAVDFAPAACMAPPLYSRPHCFYPEILIPWGCTGTDRMAVVALRSAAGYSSPSPPS